MIQRHVGNVIKQQALRYDGMKPEVMEDTIIVERPLTLYLNGQEWITLLCTGTSNYFLALGFLYSEGIIKQTDEVEEWEENEETGIIEMKVRDSAVLRHKLKGKRTVTTGCGKGTVFYDVLDSLSTKVISNNCGIHASTIIKVGSQFQRKSRLFIDTGGVHACGLYHEDQLVCFHEDIGRHNALDKIIGEAISKKIDINNTWLFTSGRITSEMILKSAKMNIGILISRSAPTSLALEIAANVGMTVIGFARGNRFNLYTGHQRVSFDNKE